MRHLLSELLEAHQYLARSRRMWTAWLLGILGGLGIWILFFLIFNTVMHAANARENTRLAVATLVPLVIWLAFIGIVVGVKCQHSRPAEEDLHDLIRDIQREFPQAIQAWGGIRILESSAAVEELVDRLTQSFQ